MVAMAGKNDRFAGMDSDLLPRLLDIGERLIFTISLIFFYFANIHAHDPTNVLVVANDAITVFFIFFRRRTSFVSRCPSDWALALMGSLGGMLMRPGGAPLTPETVSAVLVLEGVAIELAAKLSLNRRFGIAPANRGIQARWAYRIVRHPMYLGYLLIHTGYCLENPTFYNTCVLAAVWGCQYGRILREERFLLGDPAYRAYAERVRFRMVPLLF